MKVVLHIWRQQKRATPQDPKQDGRMVRYELDHVSPDMSFLEMLDVLNERLIGKGEDPVAFDHDCREGVCGSCGVVIDGVPHGPERGTTTCQLHMRSFRDGAEIWVEPWRAKAFPVLRDLVVDRSAFDKVVQAGAFVSVNTGAPQDANAIPVPKADADRAFDAATCIGCGACVAACKNASAMLFVGAKVSHFLHLPQGRVERETRARNLVAAMDAAGFGNCTNQLECEAVCPKEIPVRVIAEMNREFVRARLVEQPASGKRVGGDG
ncbi:MAG: succinate dehydrogenase/fumarate reductase iron-sulfur subunit [Planctomycetes bacterium]|nr:succinate dehydrogenase/fumarate reductase iron-sulfur subunit [Planctomycetota bacterium]